VLPRRGGRRLALLSRFHSFTHTRLPVYVRKPCPPCPPAPAGRHQDLFQTPEAAQLGQPGLCTVSVGAEPLLRRQQRDAHDPRQGEGGSGWTVRSGHHSPIWWMLGVGVGWGGGVAVVAVE